MNPNASVTLQDIRNQRSKHSALLDGGLPVIQALIRDLDNKFTYHEVINEHHHLVAILLF